jgi:hypothetical protein
MRVQSRTGPYNWRQPLTFILSLLARGEARKTAEFGANGDHCVFAQPITPQAMRAPESPDG